MWWYTKYIVKYAEHLGYSVSHSKDARWEARDQEHEQHGGRALGGGMGRQVG